MYNKSCYAAQCIVKKSSKLTHYFYFTQFHGCIHQIIPRTVGGISLWSFIDEDKPLSDVVDCDVLYRSRATGQRVMLVH